jgi:hypothetical protein
MNRIQATIARYQRAGAHHLQMLRSALVCALVAIGLLATGLLAVPTAQANHAELSNILVESTEDFDTYTAVTLETLSQPSEALRPPSCDGATVTYRGGSVAKAVMAVRVTPISAHSTDRIEISGDDEWKPGSSPRQIASGDPSGGFHLEDSVRTITLKVTGSGGTVRCYVLHITRLASGAGANPNAGGPENPLREGRLGLAMPGAASEEPTELRRPTVDSAPKPGSQGNSAKQQSKPRDRQDLQAPGPVGELQVDAGPNSVVVSWQAPESGGPVSRYIVHLSAESGGKGKTKNPKAKKQSVTFNNLEPGQTYKIWVRARNDAGKSERIRTTVTLPIAE